SVMAGLRHPTTGPAPRAVLAGSPRGRDSGLRRTVLLRSTPQSAWPPHSPPDGLRPFAISVPDPWIASSPPFARGGGTLGVPRGFWRSRKKRFRGSGVGSPGFATPSGSRQIGHRGRQRRRATSRYRLAPSLAGVLGVLPRARVP